MKIVICNQTNTKFALKMDATTSKPYLMAKDGSRIDNFYTLNHNTPVAIKTLGKQVFELLPGEVYIWSEEKDKPYHYKYLTKWEHRTNFKKIRW